MVILRRNLGWIDQEQIAKEMGAAIWKDAIISFNEKLKIAKTAKDAGVSLKGFKEAKIKKFFIKHKLPLKAEVFYVSGIKDVKKFIADNLKKGNDVMLNIHMKHFDKKKKYGHFTLVSELNGDKVTMCDPTRTHKSFWKADVNEVVKSMGKQFDKKERGFVIFTRT